MKVGVIGQHPAIRKKSSLLKSDLIYDDNWLRNVRAKLEHNKQR